MDYVYSLKAVGHKHLLGGVMKHKLLLCLCASAAIFSACTEGGESCSEDIANAEYKLPDLLKEIGNFNSTEHYVTDDGVKFKLKLGSDTIVWRSSSRYAPCVSGKEEVRYVTLSSDYPIINVEMEINDHSISYTINKDIFYILMDSTGIAADEYSVKSIDSLEVNKKIYTDVFEVTNRYANDSTSSLYLNKDLSIIKASLRNGLNFVLDNSSSETTKGETNE